MSTPVTPETQGGRRLANSALTVASIVGVLCLISTVLALSFGIRPLIFETDSMAPAAPTGSLGISRTVPANSVHPGDIVTVTADDGTRLTHRVVTVGSFAGNSATLRLKGDANNVVDPGKYVKTTVDHVYWTLPYLGYFVSWLKNPMTLALEGLGLLILLAIAFAPRQGWRNSPAGQRFLAGTAAASVVAVVVSGAQAPGEAQAAPPLSATATGTISTGLPTAPTSATCKNVSILVIGSTAEISFPNPAVVADRGRYSFEFRIAGQTGSFYTVDPTSASTVTVTFSSGILTALLNFLFGDGDKTVEIYSKVGNFYSPVGPRVPLRTKLLPIGAVCNPDAGTYTATNGIAGRQSGSSESSSSAASTTSNSNPSNSTEPSSTQPTRISSSSPSVDEPEASSTTATTPGSTTPTTAKPTLPPGGTTTASGSYVFYQAGGAVMIREASSTDVAYRGSFPASSSVRWLPKSEQLEVTEPDGTVVVVSQSAGVWTEAATPPPPSQAEPPPANEQQPTEQPSRAPVEPTLSKPVPVAPSSEQLSE